MRGKTRERRKAEERGSWKRRRRGKGRESERIVKDRGKRSGCSFDCLTPCFRCVIVFLFISLSLCSLFVNRSIFQYFKFEACGVTSCFIFFIYFAILKQ